jgi:hypothetical protein
VFAALKSRFAPARSSFQAIHRGGVPAEALASAGSAA